MDWTAKYRREQHASWEDIAETIQQTVTMADVIGAYVPDCVPRQHRIPCPIHSGKDYNFSFTDKGYKCFVCNESGDVIKFVQTVCSLHSRTDAMKQINRDFHLRLPLDREITPAENKALEERRKRARERDVKRAEWERGYHALWDEWCRLDRQKRGCKPGTGAYIEAALNLDRVSYEIDCYPNESEMMNY